MKKIHMILGAAMLVLAAGCQGLADMTPDNQETPSTEPTEGFALYANLPMTRTVLDKENFTLSWNKNDQMVVFNAPAGTEEYSSNLRFYIDEEITGKFTPGEGVILPFEDGVNYDWYVCFPFRQVGGKPELVTPKGQSSDDGYFPIGVNTQKGYNNAEHLSSFDIMVGKVENTRTPKITLKHLAVLQKFTVTNNSDKPTVITKLTFNGGENKIFGTFRVDLTSDNPELSVDNANSLYNERALTVTDGTELAVGASADFYMVMAPFTLNVGETFTVTIETTTGTQVVEKTATTDIEFSAGTYNTASLVYDFVPDYADHLYQETFNGTFKNSASVGTDNTSFTPTRWDSYDKGGMTVYDENIAAVSYVRDDNSTLTRQVATNALKGMDDLHVRFNKGGVLIVNGIKLHGKTDLNLSFVQTYKASGIKSEYSVNGTDWTELGTTALDSSTLVAYDASYDFTVLEGSTTISLRFTATAASPRIDNIKLTWQAD